MNAAHLHLIMNHFSLFLIPLGIFFFFISKEEKTQKWALRIVILGGIMTLVAFKSGEGAEEIVERIAGISHDALEEHESAAKFSMISGLIIALIAGALHHKIKNLKLKWALLILGLWSFSVLARTSYLGGFIRHPEIHDVGHTEK